MHTNYLHWKAFRRNSTPRPTPSLAYGSAILKSHLPKWRIMYYKKKGKHYFLSLSSKQRPLHTARSWQSWVSTHSFSSTSGWAYDSSETSWVKTKKEKEKKRKTSPQHLFSSDEAATSDAVMLLPLSAQSIAARLVLAIFLMLIDVLHASDYKTLKNYGDFVNTGVKLSSKSAREKLPNQIEKSKVDVLGSLLKKQVESLRKTPNKSLELVFLIDSSASVGAENFFNELKFVKKLLADFTVEYNATRVSVITFSSRNRVVKHIDHVSIISVQNHKCSLFDEQLPLINYQGGGTYTLGAVLQAQVSEKTFAISPKHFYQYFQHCNNKTISVEYVKLLYW